MTKSYKYRGGIGVFDKDGKSIFERDIDTIVNNQIYLPIKHELNDPTEGFYNDYKIVSLLERFKDYSEDVRDQYSSLLERFSDIGIYSLSKDVTSELLWAYYGSGHLGFAIEYDIEKLKESINHNRYFHFIFDFDVKYVNSIPKTDISFFRKNDINNILRTHLGSKSMSWKHEVEYRLIIDEKGLFDIDYRAITGIYFGYRMNNQEIDYVMEKLKGRNLKYYKMDLTEKSYKFKSVEIEDRYLNAPLYIANNLSYNIDDLLMPKELLGEEAYSYKEKLVEALEIVKFEPLITEIYIATIVMDSGEPIFKIYAYTGTTPPIKSFFFKLNSEGKPTRFYN